MIATKFAVFVATLTLVGISSPLAAMAQVPGEDDGVDTNLAGLIGISSDVLDRVSDAVDVGVAEIRPNVPPCIFEPSQNPQIGIGIPSRCLQT
jgi:hypothetical protein